MREPLEDDDGFYKYERDFEKEAELSHSSYLSDGFKANLALARDQPNYDPQESKVNKKNKRL